MTLSDVVQPSISGSAGRVDGRPHRLFLFVSAIGLLAAVLCSLAIGPTGISFSALPSALDAAINGASDVTSRQHQLVLLDLRLPRTLIGAFVGAALAVSGVMMQGLFRNPLADPGIVGVSAGAALAAVATIALGDSILKFWVDMFGVFALPLSAFLGGSLATALLVFFVGRGGQMMIGTLLLAGVALEAIGRAGTGLIAHASSDQELRDLTLWQLGSLTGASWEKVVAVVPFAILLLLILPRIVRMLNGLLLGEAEAFHLGIDVQRAKFLIVTLTALAVGASVQRLGGIMISLENVSVRIGEAVLLRDIQFVANPGELVAVVGPNGAGKSTLLKVLSGEQKPSSGTAVFDGRDLSTISAAELAGCRAVVPQSTHLSFPFTVAEVVALGVSVPGFGTQQDALSQEIQHALSRVDLEAFADRSYTTLSGGERQRVHFARALCQLDTRPTSEVPGLLLLDEPTASLDLAHQLLILEEARALADEGQLVIAVLHDLNLASTFADRIVVLSHGAVAATGTASTIMSNELLSRVFGCDVEVGVTSPDNLYYVIPQYCRLASKRGGRRSNEQELNA